MMTTEAKLRAVSVGTLFGWFLVGACCWIGPILFIFWLDRPELNWLALLWFFVCPLAGQVLTYIQTGLDGFGGSF